MATFSNFLKSFDPETKGKQFEHFVKWFLKNDPEWSTQIDQVWLWDEYPDRWGRDCGIDLVFKHKNKDIWAVQAKCYSPEYAISKSDVDKFLSESNRTGIDKRLLIATTDQMGKNAQQVCHAQEKTVTHFLLSDFDQAAIEYPEHISALNSAKRKPRPTPRPHQIEAIDAVEQGFKESSRGQLIMACGTGKTYATLWIKERQAAVSTLVLLPSLGLLSQSLREWTYAANTPFDVLCVCSDQTVGKQASADDIIHSVKDLSFPVTSDMHVISQFLNDSGNKVIFSTYQSSPIIADAQLDNNIPEFDLVIADEAHRCTGKAGSDFTMILDQSRIRANKRLFTTATPKTYSANLKNKASEMGVDITGMDDESVFGKVLYSLTFGEAIKRKLLTDYQVVLVGVDNPMIADWIQQGKLVTTDAGDTQDAKSLASQIGLIKAIKDYDLKRMISFHSRVNRAETFASEIQNSIDLIEEEYRPDGKVWADFVSGKMSTHKRRLKLDQLKSLTISERGLLSNARCLAEGVDIPSLDGVAFIDPRGSHVDIIQAVGRAIRLSDDKTIGTIVVPVFIEDGDNIESSMQSSHFKPVWEVLNALKSHDEVLAYELDELRTNLGRGNKLTDSGKNFSKIAFDLPITIDESFAEALKTFLIEKTTSSWNFWFGLLEVFVEYEGHARVPSEYNTVDGFKLGQWIGAQRSKREQLTAEQKSRLESLNGWTWNVLELQWEQGFNNLEKHFQQKGHIRLPTAYKTENGFKLAQWVSNQRANKEKLTLERRSKLESLEYWAWDVHDNQWEQSFVCLDDYVQQQGHAQVPNKYKTADGFTLGQWVIKQRRVKTQLTVAQVLRLESLPGWLWDPLESQWEQGFIYLDQYVQQQGNTLVPATYKTADKFNLGGWVNNQRQNKDKLSTGRTTRLESLDSWVWDATKFIWEKGFTYLEQYVEQEGHPLVPRKYKASDGFNLGSWLGSQKTKREQLTTEQQSKLESLEGWVWDVSEFQWEQGFTYLQEYVQQKGHIQVPTIYKTVDNFKLGHWVGRQRRKEVNLTKVQKKKLESLVGWVWDLSESQWEQGYNHLKKYSQQQGDARVPKRYKTADKYNLGTWVSTQRENRDKLTAKQRAKLELLESWSWAPSKSKWEEGYTHLQQYIQQQGHISISRGYKIEDGFNLDSWINNQKSNKEKLTQERISRLEELDGWAWSVLEFQWEQGFTYVQKYIQKEGHVLVPATYKTADKFNLGTWVSTQRVNRDRLTTEQQSRLESLGCWVWDVWKFKWEKAYAHLCRYAQQKGHAKVPRSYKTLDGFTLGDWVGSQRQNKEQLTVEQISKLESLEGWVWDVLEFQWEQGFTCLEKYVQQEGHAIVPQKYKTDGGFNLGIWVGTQRNNKRKLTPEQISRLESFEGWCWDLLEYKWEQGFIYLEKYKEQHGHAIVPQKLTTTLIKRGLSST